MSDVRRATDWAVAACFFRALVVLLMLVLTSSSIEVSHVEFFATQSVGESNAAATSRPLTVKSAV